MIHEEFDLSKEIAKMKQAESMELIGGFMSVSFPPEMYQGDRGGKYGVTIKGTQYHTSWDWLMPVAEKIGEMDDELEWFLSESHEPLPTIFFTKEEVYDFVIKFIRFHNERTKLAGAGTENDRLND